MKFTEERLEQAIIELLEKVLRNHKENNWLQILSLLLLQRIAKKNISDESVIYKQITDLILTVTKDYNSNVVLEMLRTAISFSYP